MTSTSPGTAMEGMSETAMRPMAARSGIRAVSTTWSTMIVSRPVPPTISSDSAQARIQRRRAERDLLAGLPRAGPAGRGPSRASGMTHSSAVSRRKTSIMNATQTPASIRLTASAGSR